MKTLVCVAILFIVIALVVGLLSLLLKGELRGKEGKVATFAELGLAAVLTALICLNFQFIPILLKIQKKPNLTFEKTFLFKEDIYNEDDDSINLIKSNITGEEIVVEKEDIQRPESAYKNKEYQIISEEIVEGQLKVVVKNESTRSLWVTLKYNMVFEDGTSEVKEMYFHEILPENSQSSKIAAGKLSDGNKGYYPYEYKNPTVEFVLIQGKTRYN
ncbi:MAG: hypothetical protein LBN93_11010 [Candidatus Symbiothrix sp.]|jgi:hypothetical protein|nr:hypothetical protein [Candidatus Symbiothrix sp.]